MKRILFLFFSVFIQQYLSAQITDSFADGNFTSSPTWTLATPTDFTVSSGQLKSANTTTNSNFYISTTNTLTTNCQWEFYANLQFNTSSTNYVDAYLASDVSNLQATSINGYFVRIGGTLDEICLYKRSGAITTATKIIDGVDGITNVSNNTLKIKVTCNASNVWSLERDATGTGNSYVSEGTISDATFTTAASFGFFIQQSTTTFIQKHLFDDVVVGSIIVDVTPPVLVSASAASSTAVDVMFNENVDVATSQTVSNYTINPLIGVPTSATRDASNFKLIHLIVATPLTSGTTYTLNVNNVQDVAGNALTTSTVSFGYLVFGTPNFKDIILNEIYADPSPIVNLTTCEYVELYNKSSSPFNLNGLKLTDGSALATLSSYTLAPNTYVILCPIADTAQFTALGYTNKLGVSSFPSLNNSGDNLYLKTALNAIIDSVNFNDIWYRDAIKKDGGYSLELINPYQNVSCSQANNWIASNDVDGGTPGFLNSVYDISPDIVGPKITNVSVLDSLHIIVCFDDVISSTQLQIALNYNISNAIGSPSLATISNGNMCATLSLTNKLINATNYIITISGITDCNSNVLSPNTFVFSFYKAKYQDVVINELMPDPDPAINLPTEEYVELKNRTPFSINLKNWKFATTTSSKKLPDITIKPDSFIVLTGSGNANTFYNDGIKAYEVTSFPSLSNYGTTLTLRDSNNVLINAITYATSWYNDDTKKDGGWSLEQIDANNPCGGQNNWHASKDANGGTPGKRNSVNALNPDNTMPQIDRVEVINKDTIVLIFTEALDSLSLINPLSYSFDNGLTAPTYIYPISTDFKKVKLKVSTSLSLGMLYNVSLLNNIKDCAGNLMNTLISAPFALPQAPAVNDVVINEILFEPNTGGVDFVELYNRSSKTIDLKNLRIGSMDTITGMLVNTEHITYEGFLLFPETYMVISENGTIIKQYYQTTNPPGFLDIANLPTMSSDAGVVTLTDTNALVIDNFKYSSKMHFPLLVNTKGVSLERIDFNRVTNDKTNWNSAAENVGFATPAYRNSQYLKADGGSGVTIPNPLFSPDNDGYNDVLNISYKLDEPGKVANVYIYDSKGRQVRYLIKNEQLSQDGILSWNGINDENEKAPIGIYVVYVELFNLSGKVNTYKLSCTLAGKL
jgi:hypothetical protein